MFGVVQHLEQQHRRDPLQRDWRLDRGGQLAARPAARLGVAERVVRAKAAGSLQHDELRQLLAGWHVRRHRR